MLKKEYENRNYYIIHFSSKSIYTFHHTFLEKDLWQAAIKPAIHHWVLKIVNAFRVETAFFIQDQYMT